MFYVHIIKDLSIICNSYNAQLVWGVDTPGPHST